MFESQIAYVYMNNQLLGKLVRTGHRYSFTYEDSYLKNKSSINISASLPKRPEPYEQDYLFAFFEGLLSEGWMRKIQEAQQKIDEMDSFTRLINNGEELMGAVRVLKEPISLVGS